MTKKVDIAIVQDSVTGKRDISIGADGDLLTTDGFNSSIDNSLFINKRANSDEVPDILQRRGWIGDLFSRRTGFKHGSKIWLFEQKRLSDDVIAAIRDAVYEGLLWLVRNGQANSILVEVSKISYGGIRISVETTVGNNVQNRYFSLWQNTNESALK